MRKNNVYKLDIPGIVGECVRSYEIVSEKPATSNDVIRIRQAVNSQLGNEINTEERANLFLYIPKSKYDY